MDITIHKPNISIRSEPVKKDSILYDNSRKVLSVQQLKVTITLLDNLEIFPVYLAIHEKDRYGNSFTAFICLSGNQLEF